MGVAQSNKSFYIFNICFFLFLLTVSIVIYKDQYLSLVLTWMRSETFSHCIIIPIICGYLVWMKKSEFKSNQLTFSWVGILLFLVAVICIQAGVLVDVNFLTHLFIVWLVPILFLTSFGMNLFMALLFPLAYLTFAVPFGEWAIPYLIDITSWFVMGGLEILRVPVYREGNYFELTSGSYEVAKACSGIRYTLAAIALGTLFAYLSYKNMRKRILFILACIAFPVVANGIRALFIVLLAHFTNRELAVGVDHFIYGWIFFGLTMFVIFYFGSKFKDEKDNESVSSGSSNVLIKDTKLQQIGVFSASCIILMLSFYMRFYFIV